LEILSGHHRAEAARRAGLVEVRCWVRDLDDNAAYMLLATSVSQSELTALERGMHALRSGIEVKAYAGNVGRKENTVGNEVRAAKVAGSTGTDIGADLSRYFSQLVEIHAAPYWLWPSLGSALLKKRWKGQLAANPDLPDPPYPAPAGPGSRAPDS
jgi:ParB-like chromosome segregation protein Spo0J